MAARPPAGFCVASAVPPNDARPPSRRAITFVDGQNPYRCVKDTFGCSHLNYDIAKLCRAVCSGSGLILSEARFYTGVPEASDDAYWHGFWSRKLLAISRQGVRTFSRPLRYRHETIVLDGGATFTRRQGRAKGIDVRIAIDLITLAYRRTYDVAVAFSQDQDLSEVATELRRISRDQKRRIEMVSASRSTRGAQLAAGSTRRRGFGSTARCTTPALTRTTIGSSEPNQRLPRPQGVNRAHRGYDPSNARSSRFPPTPRARHRRPGQPQTVAADRGPARRGGPTDGAVRLQRSRA